MRYNPHTRQVVGAIYTDSIIDNQARIVSMPWLPNTGANQYVGSVGVGATQDVDVTIFPRVSVNDIYSSHGKNVATGGQTVYLINFITIPDS